MIPAQGLAFSRPQEHPHQQPCGEAEECGQPHGQPAPTTTLGGNMQSWATAPLVKPLEPPSVDFLGRLRRPRAPDLHGPWRAVLLRALLTRPMTPATHCRFAAPRPQGPKRFWGHCAVTPRLQRRTLSTEAHLAQRCRS